jgi:small subunit ribosomal protein S1
MNLKEGLTIEGRITRIVDEAAFIDIGTGVEAVIPRKDLDQLSLNQLEDIQVGEVSKVRVVHLPHQGANPIVSLAQASEVKEFSLDHSSENDPWKDVEESYQEGDLIQGTVRNIKNYGAFVELPMGIDGLIHVSEMQPGYTVSPWDVVKPGEQVTVRIINIDADRKRIGLSLKNVGSRN